VVHMILAKTDHERFNQAGWIVVPRLVPDPDLDRLRFFFEGFQPIAEEPAQCLFYHERAVDGTRILSRIEQFTEMDSFPGDILDERSPLISALSELFGCQPVLFKDKINLKPPGGGAFAVHQDAPAYRGFGVSNFITAMIALDNATTNNGCLELPRPPRVTRELRIDDRGEILPSELDGLQFDPVPAVAGDVLLFDGLVPHMSPCNQSKEYRRALFFTFNPSSEGNKRKDYYDAKRTLFPPESQRSKDQDYAAAGKQFNLGNPFV
jgi:hypothetical protein